MPQTPADDGRLQSPGRRKNAAEPLDAAKDNDGAERYPEPRSFDTDTPPGGHMGSAGDPAEGKRD
ncbi:hypothetical protein LJR164_000489 [Phenylobacterium sp. LjRoot164]|uniref:hypothetical protein n=1 Tax=unclassified Phenylobacterium TaxID=2640670 RepID=UPI003ECEA112